ncbi:hypothetical protein ACIBF1_17290 [Spirillospora sp. NPDC050679]
MPFDATADTRIALEAVRKYTSTPNVISEIDSAGPFRVSFEMSAKAPKASMAEAKGMTYMGLYASAGKEPFAVLADAFAPDARTWAGDLNSAEVIVWFNGNIVRSEGMLVAAAFHEFQLHVAPFWTLYERLTMLNFNLSFDTDAEKAASEIQAVDASAASYQASAQHADLALRADQLLAALHLACASADEQRKASEDKKPNLSTKSLACQALLSTRLDFEADKVPLKPVKALALKRADPLAATYGADVLDHVVYVYETA